MVADVVAVLVVVRVVFEGQRGAGRERVKVVVRL